MWSLVFPLLSAAGFFAYFRQRFDDVASLGLAGAVGFLFFSWTVFSGYWFFGVSIGFVFAAVLAAVIFAFSVHRFGFVFPNCVALWNEHRGFCVFFLVAAVGFWYLAATHYVQAQPDGWYSSGNTWGDLPFHLGVINYFLHGASFPPRYVIFNSVLGYPFLPDLSAAGLALGASIQDVLVFSGVFWFLSFLVLSYATGIKMGVSKKGSVLALVILLFSGGLGFLDFLGHALRDGLGSALMAQDYTILQPTGWTNVLTSLFLPQRTLLMGALVFAAVFLLILHAASRGDFLEAGVLAGLMPLVHWHSFLVAMGVSVVYAAMHWKKEWIWFFIPAFVVALPQVAWSLQQLSPASLIHLQLNWVANTLDPIAAIGFWLLQTGVWLLAAAFGLYCASSEQRRRFFPFGLLFVLAAFINVQPYAYDNLKFFFFVQWAAAFLISAALVAFWKHGFSFSGIKKNSQSDGRLIGIWPKLAVGLFVLILAYSGTLSIAREANLHWRLYDADDLQLADWTVAHTPADSVFLTSQAHNHPVSSLAGRIVVMGYPGWLWSHGFNYGPVQSDAAAMYAGNESLLLRYRVSYIVVDYNARQQYAVNESFFSKYPISFGNPAYRVYAVH